MRILKKEEDWSRRRYKMFRVLDIKNKIHLAFVAIVSMALIAILMALPTMLLWNWLMPVIFGLVKISFWQAIGLNLLTDIFFK